MNSGQPTTRRSCDEIANAIRVFTPAQWSRLKLAAKKHAWCCSLAPDDLLQEAMRRALEENGRKCPTHVDVVRFLDEAMRSIADGEAEKVGNRVTVVPVQNLGEQPGEADELRDATPNAEALLMDAQDEAAIREALFAIFPDDAQARDIIDGILSGFEGEELRELSGLEKTAYDSKRKLIRRRIDKKYPDGWKL